MYFQKLMRSGLLGAARYQTAAGADGGDAGGSGGAAGDDKGADNGAGEGAGGEGLGEEGGDKGLDEKSAQLLREVMDKKEKLKTERERADSLQQQLAEMQAKIAAFDGVDVDKYRKLTEQQTKLERERLASEGKFEELEQSLRAEADSRVQQVETEYKGQLAEANTQLDELRGQLASREAALRELAVDSKFGQSKFIRDELVPSPAKVHKLYGDHFEVDDKGNMVAYDKPVTAPNRVKLVDKDGKVLGFEDALRRIVDTDPDKDTILRSHVSAGANSKESSGGDAKPPIGKGLSRIQSALDAG